MDLNVLLSIWGNLNSWTLVIKHLSKHYTDFYVICFYIQIIQNFHLFFVGAQFFRNYVQITLNNARIVIFHHAIFVDDILWCNAWQIVNAISHYLKDSNLLLSNLRTLQYNPLFKFHYHEVICSYRYIHYIKNKSITRPFFSKFSLWIMKQNTLFNNQVKISENNVDSVI